MINEVTHAHIHFIFGDNLPASRVQKIPTIEIYKLSGGQIKAENIGIASKMTKANISMDIFLSENLLCIFNIPIILFNPNVIYKNF